MSDQDTTDFINSVNHTVVGCIPPIDHNSKKFNQFSLPDFYYHDTLKHLDLFVKHKTNTVVIYPTETSKIWWWHNNCKKVYFTTQMFEKKIKPYHQTIDWLTTEDPIHRARIQMHYYHERTWYQSLLYSWNRSTSFDLSLGQLRTVMAHALHWETFDYISQWSKLKQDLPQTMFIALDMLRDCPQQTVQTIYKRFKVENQLPVHNIIEKWQSLQLTKLRDQQHATIVDAVVNKKYCDWQHLAFDIFDEVWLYYVLRFEHKQNLKWDDIDCLPCTTAALAAIMI